MSRLPPRPVASRPALVMWLQWPPLAMWRIDQLSDPTRCATFGLRCATRGVQLATAGWLPGAIAAGSPAAYWR